MARALGCWRLHPGGRVGEGRKTPALEVLKARLAGELGNKTQENPCLGCQGNGRDLLGLSLPKDLGAVPGACWLPADSREGLGLRSVNPILVPQ